MKKVFILGILLGISIFVSLNAFGREPYDDTAIKESLKAKDKEYSQLKAEQTKLVNELKVINKNNEREIKYLRAVLGQHEVVILNCEEFINANSERIDLIQRDSIKGIEIIR